MNILSFDVTSNNISISVSDGDIILSQISQISNSNQSELLTTLLQKSLEEANLDYQDLGLVAFTNGPASFTSTRIGYIAAKMINVCCEIPILAISSNLAIAADYLSSSYTTIVTAIDARLGDVFFQIFNLNGKKLTEVSEVLMVNLEEIEKYLPQDEFLLVGSAKELIKCQLKNKIINTCNRRDAIKSENIIKIALEYRKDNNNKIPDEPLYIREPKIG